MYGVKFSLWLTGAVGLQTVAGRHSSTRPLAGGRLGAGIVSDTTNYHHTGPDCTSIGELKNMVINYHFSLMLWIDLWWFF